MALPITNSFGNPPIQQCPYCGNDDEYYIKESVSGTCYCNYSFNGDEVDNGAMYETLNHSQGKFAYCFMCEAKLFRIKE